MPGPFKHKVCGKVVRDAHNMRESQCRKCNAMLREEEEEIRPEDHAQYQAAKRRDTI